MNKQELLEKYLAGNLSEEETVAFDELRKTDPDFNVDVSFHDDLSEVVLEDERKRLKSILTNRKPGKTKSNSRLRRMLLIGLGLLLILATIFIFQYEKRQKSPVSIFASYFEPYPNSYRPVSRNSLNNAETQGFTAYENRNYELAAEKFDETLKENIDLSIIFYQGICYGAMGNLPDAIQNMERVKGRDFPYSTESYWYLGLYYLKQNETDRAVRHFKNFIALSKDTEKIAAAQDILQRLI
jgi:tetratricopeptide (TPR) repeat protein